uniref:Venom peptide n=1 Tax=Dasymutilla sicheliana TaxID=1175388 RepID=A0A8T9VJW9_DASSI|nr:venom peptide precursor [Dasymutilla sicheliana]
MKSLALLVIAIFMVFTVINVVHAEPEANAEADPEAAPVIKGFKLLKEAMKKLG